MLYCAQCEKGRLELMSLTTKIHSFIYLIPEKLFHGWVLQLTFLMIKVNECDVGDGDLADPLYRLPSECVTVLINNLEKMLMLLHIWRSSYNMWRSQAYLALSGFRRISSLLQNGSAGRGGWGQND